jgi:hypothetical protein
MKSRRNLRWHEMHKENIELSILIKQYEAYNKSEGKSPRTVEWHCSERQDTAFYVAA